MDTNQHIYAAFHLGQISRNEGRPDQSIFHFTRALDVFHSTVGSFRDPFFWSKLLFARAEAYLLCGKYSSMNCDIQRALTDCPNKLDDLVIAQLWYDHGSHFTKLNKHSIAASCFSAALHFTARNTNFQCKVHCSRAEQHYKLEDQIKCEQDIEVSKKLNIQLALQTGSEIKRRGMDYFHSRKYRETVHCLQLAEIFFRRRRPQDHSLDHYWHDCWKYIIIAAWQGKMYTKAIKVGKKWQQMESITSKEEATGWKDRGKEMFIIKKYDMAIECYTLSIQFAPSDDELLGILYSNRSQSYLEKNQYKKAKDDAEKCMKYRPDWPESFFRLGSALIELEHYDEALNVLKNGLNMKTTDENKYEIFKKIMLLAYKWEDGPTKITFELPHDYVSKYLKDCSEKHYWKSIELLLLGGGGHHCYAKGVGGIATGSCDLKDISLCDVIKSDPKPSQYYKLVTALIDNGALVDGRSEQEIPPLALAVNHDDHDLAVALLKKNANPQNLIKCKSGKHDDTPIHTAFRTGLTLGHWQIFIHLMVSMNDSGGSGCDTAPCSEILDKKGNSLYHLIASDDRMRDHSVEGIRLLREYKIDPTTRNKDGKTPLMMIHVRQNSDPRYRLIEESVKIHAPGNQKKKKKRKKKNKNNERTFNPVQNENKKDKDVGKEETPDISVETLPPPSTEKEILREKISKAIENFEINNETESVGSEVQTQSDPTVVKDGYVPFSSEKLTVDPLTSKNEVCEDKEPLPASGQNVSYDVNDEIDDDMVEEDDLTDDTFDNLTWEVECTAEVWKTLKDKKLPRDKKTQIVRVIKQLANGNMRGRLAKRLVGIAKESNILLFEAKLDKSARILWERAITFSPRCSDLSDDKSERRGGIYVEVIRIWDIVFDHDTVPRKIKKIVRSYNRGTNCFIKKNLKGTPVDSSSFSTKNDQKSIPKIYVPREDADKLVEKDEKPCTSTDTSKMFFPPGSPEETEYHILKFYAFSNAMVDAMLDNQNRTNFDFPFRVSELEHSVINLAPKRKISILLLGRSGTGKTTCCLYRLWNNYQKYWEQNTINEPSIPNIAQFISRHSENIADDENEADENEMSVCDENTSSLQNATQDDQNGISSEEHCQSSTKKLEHAEANHVSDDESRRQNDEGKDAQTTENEPTLEHLHQAFITKNAVLCKEVQKNFIELTQACFSTRDDVNYEQSSSNYKFDQLEDHAWPLFICSRDWLLMLDASLPGVPFFPRNDDGKLERSVRGWGEEDSNLHEIPVDYSEDEDDEEVDNKPTTADGEHKTESETDLRREITYRVFKNELWRKMTKKKKVDYHPSLVWTEIISFIKGSVEALHSEDGYITLEEYQTIGNKRASSFTADRETVYELFLAYQRIKRSLGMFDEADVVYSIYHRLEHHIPSWSIHEIYVDETQDFTQAELSVIIRSCRNPNRLFFTGDTAQSIMRGIAFRFSDLRSLFYYMKESVKSVGHEAEVVVPDRVYELTHNYRSHSGILNLASSVTDLLSYFFPESFDKLARDQGLFEGPKPVLLESCSFSDLAVILRGHKRKTSPIEFGAHQVILVASDEARDSLPEELSLALVMTIYEAKGLEFDDVLIYNFFKDSQALKEWRVVGTYKEKQDEDTNISETGIAEIEFDNLECKSRPLEFNPDLHKILISEFKYLYTAVTRARVNVWLFDESEEARAPMFEYFQKRGVVDVKHIQKTDDDDMTSLEGMFTQSSTKEEWKKQGLFFYGKGLWKVALRCFLMAGEEMWVKRCNAHKQAATAATLMSEPRKLRLEFMEAAELFIECGMKDEAEKCLYNARERLLLAQLHEKCKSFRKAARILRKEGKFSDAARNFESSGDFQAAVDCLLKVNRYNEVLDLVSKYNDLIEHGKENTITHHLRPDQRAESICYQAAKFYQRRGDYQLMSDALERLPNVEDRITFLQKNEFFDEAAELLLKERRAQEAARLMRSKGKFLQAAGYSDDDKFTADCYLLAARSALRSTENGILDAKIQEHFESATKMYKKCNNLNGQAEVKFARGLFCQNVEDLEEALELFFLATNYPALTDCFLKLMSIETDQKKFSRPKAIQTVKGLLHLILALHKKSKESLERTAISMCQEYFGIEDTDHIQTKKVPKLEMVRFSRLQDETKSNSDEIPAKEVEKLITENLFQMARNLIEQLWTKHQEINDRCTPCPRFIADNVCDNTICKYHHAEITKAHFDDRFYALLFLVHLEETIAAFLKDMRRESAKVKNHLQKLLFIFPEFKACQWLYELLFPRNGQLVSSFFLSERNVSFLRNHMSVRITEYAKTHMWYGTSSKEETRWSSSDLFIEVSNMMHIAGAGMFVDNLLSVEERRFEQRRIPFHPAMFCNVQHGHYSIFSKALERSKTKLYVFGEVLGSVHAAVRKFLYTPAKRRGLPYPSIANVVMILERQLTACLMLYARLMMNDTIVCLPESYISMTNFWDFVDRPLTNRSFTFYNAVQQAPQHFQGPERERNFNHLRELMRSMVDLAFGEVNWKYNIVNDTFCDTSVNCIEAERVLVLVLVMLCNCGRGIPGECEQLIRESIFTLQLRQDLPVKLTKCVDGIRKATDYKDVVLCLSAILAHKPRQEKLCDVKWDDRKGKDSRRNCRAENYSLPFYYKIDESKLTISTERKKGQEEEIAEDEMNQIYSEMSKQDETYTPRQEYNEDEKAHASRVIERAFLSWKNRKEKKAKLEEEMKNDEVRSHFQPFKLDKSGCTICGKVQFVDPRSNVTNTTSDPSLSAFDQDEEALTWQPSILQRNTLTTHCSRGNPHWKKEKLFVKFKDLYQRRVQPTVRAANKVKDEMLQVNTEADFSLDRDRLDNALSRLQTKIKKIEDERSWDSVNLILNAVEEIDNETKQITNAKGRRGDVNRRRHSVEQEDSGDELGEIGDDTVGHLKDIHKGRPKKRNLRSKRR